MYWDVFAYLGYGLILMLIVMGILYGVYRQMGEPSVVDIGWAAGLGALSLSYFYFTDDIGARQIVVVILAVIWSIRLVAHLFIRFRKGILDKRYVYLTRIWAENLSRNFFLFSLFQGVAAVAVSLVFAIAMLSNAPFGGLDIAGIVLFAVGFLGESWTDWTLKQFREDPSNQGQICEKGLWRYSRHPNYFFEIIIWIGFAFFALPASYGFIGFFSPLLIAIFIIFFTGIPPTEKQLLESKGDAYRQYQQTTSMLIPWLRRKRLL